MANKKKTRMYEPWGYQEENNYQGGETILDNDLESFFAGTSYNKDDNKIYFTNKDGEVKASLDVNEFVKSDSIIDHTEYKDGILKIYFTNGDVVTIDLTELLDENEFKDGLIVDGHVVKVLIDGESDKYVSVSENGIKVAGIEADIEAEEARAISAETALDEKIDAEIERATAEEQRIDAKLDQEISDREADVDAEEARAIDEETTIKNTIGGGFSTASTETVTAKFNALSTALDTEIGNRTTQDNQLQNNINTESTARQAADTRLENLITDERNRAKAAEEALDAKIDQEIADREADVDEEEARAKAAEEALQAAIDAEEARATSAETDLQTAIEAEGQRAQDAEAALDAKIDQEIADRTADVDAEEARAISAETELAEGIEILGSVKFDEVVYNSSAKTITFYAEGNVKGEIDTTDFVKDGMIDDVKIENDKLVIVFNTDAGKETIEIPLSEIFNPDNYYDKTDIDNIVSGINSSIAAEETRAEAVEQGLQESISSEASTARAAEQANADAISAEETARIEADEAQDAVIAIKADASAVTEAIAAEETRAIGAENDILDVIDGLNGIKFDDVAYDSSAKTINFIADGNVVKGLDATPFIKDGMIDDVKIEGGNLVIIFNTDSGKEEIDIPLTDIFDPSNYYTKAEVDGFIGDLQDAIAAEEARAISAETDLQTAIDLKADKETTYTQEEVDALLLAKENEIYNLTKIVGDIGGAVTYDLPNPAGKSFNTLMNNNGTVKLTDDVTTGRFGPGITAKNKVKLNLNNNDLTVTGLTITSAQGAIMARGTQEITIGGKGTIDAGNGICVEGNGADSVINLTGSTTVYQTDRSGGELIYCYAGTINITNGTFKNNGEDKKYLLNCYDANYRAGTAKIVVTGGKFYDFNPADNTAEGEHTSFVPEGYHVEESQDGDSTVYTVKKD